MTQHSPLHERDAQEQREALHDRILDLMRVFNERCDANAPTQELIERMNEIHALQGQALGNDKAVLP